MKKLLAIFVLALFVVGMLPLAFAEDAADDSTTDAPARGREKARERLLDAREKALEDRQKLIEAKDELLAKHEARVAELIERCKETGKTEEECNAQFQQRLGNIAASAPKFREKLQQFEANREERIQKLKELRDDEVLGQFGRAKEFRARALDRARIANAQANLAKARERYQEALAGLDKAKLRLEQAKTSKVCKASPESEECAKAREELRASAKEKLLKHADIILNSLESGKEKAVASEYLTDKEEAAAVAFFDEQIAKFTAIKTEIESAETKEAIVEAGKELAVAWKEMKHKINAYIESASNARMAGIVVKAEHLAAKLERVMERMAENGKDTSAVEPLVAEFKAKLELAKTKFKSAHSLLLEVRTSELSGEDKKAKLDEANALVKEARKALQDANAKLREIFLKLKEAGATAELAAATAAEEVEAEAEENAAEESAKTTEAAAA
ncbi:MAG: hypothetical protein QME12_04150 [Nanoarchaeota archaeon]|nr:hypothetical protein [Nanoarchaeota archaeon]